MKNIPVADTTQITGGDNPGMGPYDAPIRMPISHVICKGFGVHVDGQELQLCGQAYVTY